MEGRDAKGCEGTWRDIDFKSLGLREHETTDTRHPLAPLGR
jgi:hypothetical protein